MKGLTLALGLVAGCYSPAPSPGAPCSPSGSCPSGLVCVDAVCQIAGQPAPDSSIPLDACGTATCDGDDLVGCGARVTCANGCGGSAPHCLELAPSNGLSRDLTVGATNEFALPKMDFDGTTGRLRVMGNDYRPEGTGVINGIRFEIIDGVGVFAAKSWTLPAGESWSFGGANPVALLAAETITIDGTIDVGGTGALGGPGGSDSNPATTASGCRGRAGRLNDATHGEGGGGGGGATAGGSGAASNIAGATGAGGPACTTGATTIPLRGGAGGGEGGDSLSNDGGGGGGAIALVALRSITITGTVAAPGAGGRNVNSNGGGGGGGGGAVFVEAPEVTITGAVTANGGGGGAPSGGVIGARGSLTTATPALGGNFTGTGGPARGGNGAAGVTPPTAGASYNLNVTDPTTGVVTNTNRGGGGGGAAGRIEVKRRAGGVTGLASPPASITDAMFD